MNETQPISPNGGKGESGDDICSERTLNERKTVAREALDRFRGVHRFSQVDWRGFADHLMQMLDTSLMTQGYLESLYLEDLYLAYACGCGNQAALHEFAQLTDQELRSITRKLRLSATQYDDNRQILWDKLFLSAPDRGPKIFEYRGAGPLLRWFRVLANRTALDHLRSGKRQQARDGNYGATSLNNALPDRDPELASIRSRYQGTFKNAFENAVKALATEERNVLRCTYVAGMSTDELGRAFGMHKATAARHVAQAREHLYALTRKELKLCLGANTDELESVIRLFDGELSISLSLILK